MEAKHRIVSPTEALPYLKAVLVEAHRQTGMFFPQTVTRDQTTLVFDWSLKRSGDAQYHGRLNNTHYLSLLPNGKFEADVSIVIHELGHQWHAEQLGSQGLSGVNFDTVSPGKIKDQDAIKFLAEKRAESPGVSQRENHPLVASLVEGIAMVRQLHIADQRIDQLARMGDYESSEALESVLQPFRVKGPMRGLDTPHTTGIVLVRDLVSVYGLEKFYTEKVAAINLFECSALAPDSSEFQNILWGRSIPGLP